MQFITDTIQHEGGWSNHIADKGGKTKFGITLATFKSYLGSGKTEADLRALTADDAREFYKKFFWDKTPFPKLPAALHPIMFDMGVNHGQGNASRILQKALKRFIPEIVVDGAIGPKTIDAAAKLSPDDLVLQRVKFFYDIVENNPSQGVFLKGWLKRALFYMEN